MNQHLENECYYYVCMQPARKQAKHGMLCYGIVWYGMVWVQFGSVWSPSSFVIISISINITKKQKSSSLKSKLCRLMCSLITCNEISLGSMVWYGVHTVLYCTAQHISSYRTYSGGTDWRLTIRLYEMERMKENPIQEREKK